MEALPLFPVDHPADYSLTLEARDPARNIARSYTIEVSRDLFGWTVVACRWGRIGRAGHRRCRAFADRAEAGRFLRGLLRRRASASRRFGVAYRAVAGHGTAIAGMARN